MFRTALGIELSFVGLLLLVPPQRPVSSRSAVTLSHAAFTKLRMLVKSPGAGKLYPGSRQAPGVWLRCDDRNACRRETCML